MASTANERRSFWQGWGQGVLIGIILMGLCWLAFGCAPASSDIPPDGVGWYYADPGVRYEGEGFLGHYDRVSPRDGVLFCTPEQVRIVEGE